MDESVFRQGGGSYSKAGDYLLPDIVVDGEEVFIGPWGQRHLRFLRKTRPITHTNLLTAGELAKEILRGYRDTPTGQAACEEGRALGYDSKEELMIALPSLLQDGDAILVKASHFMGFEDIVDALKRS